MTESASHGVGIEQSETVVNGCGAVHAYRAGWCRRGQEPHEVGERGDVVVYVLGGSLREADVIFRSAVKAARGSLVALLREHRVRNPLFDVVRFSRENGQR